MIDILVGVFYAGGRADNSSLFTMLMIELEMSPRLCWVRLTLVIYRFSQKHGRLRQMGSSHIK
jgi:hypothetical protein